MPAWPGRYLLAVLRRAASCESIELSSEDDSPAINSQLPSVNKIAAAAVKARASRSLMDIATSDPRA